MTTSSTVATDEELAARVGTGDSMAFGELYERYFDGAYDFTMRIVRDPDVAADVVQGTFTRAWETLQADEPPRRFKAWLYTVARNRAIDQIRDRKRVVSLLDGDSADDDDRARTPSAALIDADRLGNPAEAARDTEVAEIVWAAASSLTPDEYSLLDMHLRRDLSAEEIAAELEIKTGTLYTRLSRLRDSVEEALAAELLKRRGRADCPELDALITEIAEDTIDRTARRRILRHAEKCEICSENRRRFVTAAELLPALAPIPAVTGLKGELWERLPQQQAGGPSSPTDQASQASQAASASSGGGGIAIGGVAISAPVLAGAGALAAVLVAAVVFLGGGSGGVTITDPGDVASVSHQIGEVSSQRAVTVAWSPHDPAAAYSIDWTNGPRDLPDAIADLDGSATGATSGSLATGEWYFHLRTQGEDGSWTSTVHLGPFMISENVAAGPAPTVTAPTVTAPTLDLTVTVRMGLTPTADPEPVPATLGTAVPEGMLLVYEYEGVYYVPLDLHIAPIHLPNCAYAHLHGSEMQSLLPGSDGEYLKLAEPLGDCGFGPNELYLLDDPR